MMNIELHENEKVTTDEIEHGTTVKEWFSAMNQGDTDLYNWLDGKGYLRIRKKSNGHCELKAGRYVGTAPFSQFTVRIIPKIFKKPMSKQDAAMLTEIIDYADSVRLKNISESHEIYTSASTSITLREHYGLRLTQEVEELLRRGLLKSYVTHEEDVKSLRGKLIMQNQMRNDSAQRMQFFCEFDELEYDNVENRIILQALMICERTMRDNQVGAEVRRRVFRLIQQFSGLVDTIQVTSEQRKRVMQSYTRQNEHYKGIHETCSTILDDSGVSDIYHGRQARINPIFVPMYKVFEDFVTRMMKELHPKKMKECDNCGKRKVKVLGNEGTTEQGWDIEDGGGKNMRPDIIMECQTCHETRKEIDVKYKPVTEVGDLYQVGFYMHEYGEGQEEGLDNAYVILPKYYGETVTDKTYTAQRSKKKVHEKRVDIKDYMRRIKERDPEIRSDLDKLIEN